MYIKKTLSVMSAALLTFSCATVNAAYTDASLISDIRDKLNNYVFDYFSTIEETGGYSSAEISMASPYGSLEFRNIAEDELTNAMTRYYAGTIEAKGEKYIVVRKKGISNEGFKLDDLAEKYNEYIFYHVCPEGSDPDESYVFPLYELIEGAKHFGLETGELRSVTLDENEYECKCDVSVLKDEDEDTPYKVYSDISERKTGHILIDGYNFYSPEYYVASGSKMTARPEGRFTVDAKEYKFMSNEKYVDSYAEINLNMTSLYELNSHNDISVDYNIDDRLDGKYGMVYTLYVADTDADTRTELRIAEKISGMDVEGFFKSYEASYGIGNKLAFRSCELVKTYTANGHEYDLYKGNYHFYGDISGYDEICYLAVRKDTADSVSYGSSISVYDHTKNIPELSSGATVLDIELAFHNCGAAGTIDVTKNKIDFIGRSAPEAITGDLNNDGRVDSLDIVFARKAILSKVQDEKLDINKNGSFDIADIVLLQSYVLGKIKTLP